MPIGQSFAHLEAFKGSASYGTCTEREAPGYRSAPHKASCTIAIVMQLKQRFSQRAEIYRAVGHSVKTEILIDVKPPELSAS